MAKARAVELGGQILAARQRREWTQRELGQKVDLSPSRIGQIETGDGASASLETWLSLAVALDLPLRVEFGRDKIEQPTDAGHLQIQELALRRGRALGRDRTFELATRPSNPGLSVDVGLVDHELRLLLLQECWNTFGNINLSIRSTRRKIAEIEQLATSLGGEAGPYQVSAVWIVRDTRRNREILERYPEVFAAAFTGSSAGWVRALITPGKRPPQELGLVWCDQRVARFFVWRGARTRADP
jgi:transcriptional regulator with XRE-family HTH domain